MVDWTDLYKKYKGRWVALKDDEKTVVGSGKTAKAALLRARENGYKSPILNYFPAKLTAFAGGFRQ